MEVLALFSDRKYVGPPIKCQKIGANLIRKYVRTQTKVDRYPILGTISTGKISENSQMKELLSKIGWSQRFFAEKVGVSEDTVSEWCRHRSEGPGYKVAMAYLELVSRLIK